MTIYDEKKNQYKYEFSSMKTNMLYDDTRQEFEEYHVGLWINTHPFKVELDTKEVDLHVYIDIMDMSEFTDDSDECIVTLGVIPSFNSLTDNCQEKILNQFIDEDRKRLLKDKEQLLMDILDYGYAIQLYNETVKSDNLKNTIDSAMAVSPCIKGLIGFELDRMVNRIGNIGWDLLRDFCEGIDLIRVAIERYKQ